MPPYYTKIEVKREPQIIKYSKTVTIYGTLTLEKLRKHIKENESFYVLNEENSTLYPDCYRIEILKQRLETDAELKKRVEKEELYNKNYELFHEKRKNK